MTAVFPDLAKRVQLVACVPPLTKVPNTRVIAAATVISLDGVIASKPASPPASEVAMVMLTATRIIMAGTATRDSHSRPR